MTEAANGISFLERPQFQRRALIVFAVFLLLACLAVWGLYGGSPILSSPPKYKDGAGAEYARTLAEAAQRLSIVLLVAGWMLVPIGSILAMTAAVVGQVKRQQEEDTLVKTLLRQRGLLCGAFAIILASAGWQCLDRSSAASRLASIATRAASAVCDADYDKKAYKACVDAKALWLEGRMNHDRIQSIADELGKSQKKPDRSTTPRGGEAPKPPDRSTTPRGDEAPEPPDPSASQPGA